eukprot:SAG11_NODE_3523_length_2395_cov_1.335801_3_plen_97_part_01
MSGSWAAPGSSLPSSARDDSESDSDSWLENTPLLDRTPTIPGGDASGSWGVGSGSGQGGFIVAAGTSADEAVPLPVGSSTYELLGEQWEGGVAALTV